MVCYQNYCYHCLSLLFGILTGGLHSGHSQATIDTGMYMELPKGIETHHRDSKDHVLMLLANLYGQKQAGSVWNSYLIETFCTIVFYHDDIIFNVYVDDGIFLEPNDCKLTQTINKISKTCLEIVDHCHPADYYGVVITKHNTGYIKLTQRALIDVHLNDAHTKPIPVKINMQLHAYRDSKKFSECNFELCSVTVELSWPNNMQLHTSLTLNKNTEKQFCTWCDIQLGLNFALTYIKALSVTVMLTAQEIGRETLHSLTLAL
ncbi:LOW QUALITY PROTEIN: hypothetical protein ACHAW6_011753 [Cyclotella cf. meneghiniana]